MFGICGIVTPLVAFVCISLAVTLSPHFSWAYNALSDLGVMAGSASILFNSGLIVSGALALLFTLGLFVSFKKSLPGRVGALLFSFDSAALIVIGIFPENARPMHLYASEAFFALAPVSMFFLTASFFLASKVREGLLTLGSAMFSATVWIAEFLWWYVPGVAIPETLSALSVSLWVVIIGFDMARDISHFGD